MKTKGIFLIAILSFVLAFWLPKAHAISSYYTSQGCSGCHGSTVTCNGCHQHGAHSSLNGPINIKGATNKTSYSSGETVSVTITGGWQSGWIRAILYDQNMTELARNTGPTGMGGGAGYPVTLTAPAPATPGTYTWNVSWYGNYVYNPGPFQTTCSGSITTNCWKPSSNPNHGEEIVATNSFTVVSSTPPPTPAISITDSVAPATDLSVPFGSVNTGSSANQTVTVTNTGTANLLVGAIGSTNALTAPFSKTADTCSNQTIAPSGSCTMTVSFAPTATGTFTDSFNIPSNDPAKSSITMNVSGTGAAAPTPAISVTDSVAPTTDLLVPFGSITAGTSATQTITVTNSGNAGLIIGAVGSTNPLAAPFSITNNTCSNQTIAPSASCTMTVSFAPTATGTFTDSFNIPSNDPAKSSITVNVSGSGSSTTVGRIKITDSVSPVDDLQIPFGNVREGKSVNQTVTIANAAGGDLVIGTIASANPLASPFSIASDNCSGKTLSGGTNCSLTVSFTPPTGCASSSGTGTTNNLATSTTGSCTYSDSFDIPSNDPDQSTVTMQVSGAGVTSRRNNPPSKPKPKYPADHQQELETSLDMQWESSTDPDGDPVSYELLISTDSAFAAPMVLHTAAEKNTSGTFFASTGLGFILFGFVFAGTARGRKGLLVIAAVTILVGSSLVGCSVGKDNPQTSGAVITQHVAGLQTTTTYYWKVVASDGNGGVTESDVSTFSTK